MGWGTNLRDRMTAGGRRSSWIPWLFVAFFAVVFTVNGIMAYIALESWTGLSTQDYYKKGVAYNDALDGAQRQKELGWKVDVAFTPTGGTRGRVSVVMHGRADQPLTDARVRALFIRPTREGLDSTIALSDFGKGRYGAEVTLPLPGQWDLTVLGTYDGVTYQSTQRIYLPQ